MYYSIILNKTAAHKFHHENIMLVKIKIPNLDFIILTLFCPRRPLPLEALVFWGLHVYW